VLPVAAPSIDRLESALDNLALAATNDTAVLQQLTAANLALTATVTALTAINKKLVDKATRGKPAKVVGTPAHAPDGNYCGTHGHRVSRHHTSACCNCKAPGHQDAATAANTMGGSQKDKGCVTAAAAKT
jgi:hypothetical protein